MTSKTMIMKKNATKQKISLLSKAEMKSISGGDDVKRIEVWIGGVLYIFYV
jgi:hypothetical protein